MEIIAALINLFLILLLIVLACIIFTNAVEHLGAKHNLSEGAVGSILAAIGTALPETVIPLVAIIGAYLTGSSLDIGQKIGIGAILGAPFMLGTLAFFVTGVAVLFYTYSGRRIADMPINATIMLRDLHYFGIAYFIAIISSFIPIHLLAFKILIALVLIGIYCVYAYKTIKTPSILAQTDQSDLEALHFTKYLNMPERFHSAGIYLQTFMGLAGIVVLAHLFIGQLKFLSEAFRISPFILSLIITPIATELPEKLNSVIWIRAKKDTLAIGNITGAMVFQSCIPTAIGILLTPWTLGIEALINVIIVYVSVIIVYLNIITNKGILKPRALISAGLFYLVYLAFIVFRIVRGL